MRKVLLINIKDIKDNSIVPANTDEKILLLALNEVTDLELEPLIGFEYLSKLEQSIKDKTLEEKDKKVIEEVIKPFLIYGTLVYSIPLLHNKLGNKGVNVSTDATLSSSKNSDVNSFQNVISMKWDSYKKRLIDYFRKDDNNETKTPIDATSTGYTGIYIPDIIDNGYQYYKQTASKYNRRF